MRLPWLFLSVALFVGCGENPESSTVSERDVVPAGNRTTAGSEPEAPGAAAKGDDQPIDSTLRDLGNAVQLATVPEQALSQEELQAGWLQLFDGHTLFGWAANSGANWEVRDGAIHCSGDEPGLLLTTVPFADYELSCEIKLASGGNSGLFLRTQVNPQDPSTDCYELNVCDSHKAFKTGGLVARQVASQVVAVEGAWHRYHVKLLGKRLTARIDGQVVVKYEDATSRPLVDGRVGLQMNGGAVAFRRIRIRPLGLAPLFNGKDLAGWREVPGGKSRFSVRKGAIHVENGAGFLETERTFGDFVLQAEAKTNGENLNSGIFFRAERGTAEHPSNGYEVQIHNGMADGDGLTPSNAGTGAIFRRNTARCVMSRDREWCHLTLVATGPRMAVWVNGIQVTDWVDDRKPNANPRRGLRLDPGHLSLQGHDPTTNLDFRSLRASSSSGSSS